MKTDKNYVILNKKGGVLIVINRLNIAKQKAINNFQPTDFSKIKLGLKTVEDAVFDLGELKKINPKLADKKEVLAAIERGDINKMRDISNFFYKTSGIYNRLCRYMAYMYRYDWLITPYISSTILKEDKILSSFNKALLYLDNFQIKKNLGDIALKVIKRGVYYGYLTEKEDRMIIQELPIKYCRSRFTSAEGRPLVEFNMR